MFFRNLSEIWFESSSEFRLTLPTKFLFSDISERNNDYSNTLDFRRGWVGEVGVVTFFVFEIPDFKSAMLIYLYIYMYKKLRYRSQFWMDFHEIHMGQTYGFWK